MSLVKRQYDDFVWEYKYRPSTIDDIVLPTRFKSHFNKMVADKAIPNMLLSGPRGCGKTTVAFCLADQIGCEVKYINMSKDNSVDMVRETLSKFATSMSFAEGKKLIIGDEVDRLSINAFDALKADMDQFGKNCSYVFISNNKHTFAKHPVLSRLQEIDFEFSKEEIVQMKKEFFRALCIILKKESVKFEKKAIATLINTHFSDMRKCLNEAQKLSSQFDGKITEDAVNTSTTISDVGMLYSAMSEGDFDFIRSFVSDISVDSTRVYSTLFNTIGDYIESSSLPQSIVTIADFQYKSHFSLDKQICLTACLVTLIEQCEWKK